jgi:hypothetical protein
MKDLGLLVLVVLACLGVFAACEVGGTYRGPDGERRKFGSEATADSARLNPAWVGNFYGSGGGTATLYRVPDAVDSSVVVWVLVGPQKAGVAVVRGER